MKFYFQYSAKNNSVFGILYIVPFSVYMFVVAFIFASFDLFSSRSLNRSPKRSI